MIRITLYARGDCHLCHEMRAVVDRVAREARRRDIVVEEVDVDTEPALQAAYGSEVPVLLVNGRKAFKFRVEATALAARLAREPE